MKTNTFASTVALLATASASLYGESNVNHTCIIQPDYNYLSCSAQASLPSVDSCCVETYGGLLLQTQYWDTYTGYETQGQLLPESSWTIHGLWYDGPHQLLPNTLHDADIVHKA